jgi:MFS family permease
MAGSDHPHPQKPTRVRALVFALACLLSFVLYLHRYVWGFIKPEIKTEFGWDDVTLGWLDSLFLASYAVGQVPSGILGDWFGAHLLLGCSVLLWSLALLGTALAGGFLGLAVARLALGATQAGCYPALNKVSKNWFPVGVRTTAQGWIATFCGRAGGAASFFLFGTVLLGLLGLPWRWAVGVFAAVGTFCGVLFLLLFRNTPREHPWANAAEADLITAEDPLAARATHSRLRWSALLGSRTVWFLFARSFVGNMADTFFVYWVPSFLRGGKHLLSPTAAGGLAALPLLGGAVGGVASGSLQSRLVRRVGRRWARGGVGMTGKLLAALLMMLPLVLDGPVLVGIVFVAVKFFADWEQPAEWGTITDVAGANAATVFASVNTAGSVGGFVAGPLMGLVLKAFSADGVPTAAAWNAAFGLIAVEYVCCAACWLFIDCGKPIATDLSGGKGHD